MSFEHLRAACSLVNAQTRHHERFSDWQAKRDALAVLIGDLPNLVEQYKHRRSEPYSGNHQITVCDALPSIRLASACETITNMLYGMSEIAANFGNRASKGVLPSSFNALRKAVQAGKLGSELVVALGDLQWYEKVRELRTEWAHHSTVFIGHDKVGEPLLLARAYRRESDRIQFKNQIECSICDIITWTAKSISTIDGLAGYLLKTYVLPAFDLDAVVTAAVYDINGYPIITPDHRFSVETITVRKLLQRRGVIPEQM